MPLNRQCGIINHIKTLEFQEVELMGYIYKITNSVNRKVYIGKTTTSIEQRWKEHTKEATRDRKYKSKLYDAMNKYGIDNFKIEVVEECDNALLDERECYWIRKFKTQRNGYNITNGGDGHNVISDEEKKIILSLWGEGYSQKAISELANRNHKAVARVLRECGITREEVLARQDLLTRCSRIKPVYFYDLEGNYLRGFDSLTEAASALGIDKTTLGHILKGRQKSIHGMMIRSFKVEKIDPVQRSRDTTKIEVHQYTLEGKYVNSYPSILDATKAVGLKDVKSIRIALEKPKRTAGGFKWRTCKMDNLDAESEANA